MTPQSLVTIAIPCFNAETFIERAIKSAQSQDWPNTEILIVDDNSEDGTISIIEALAQKDKRIRLICHEANRGTAVARNTLLENAKGEFIAFFDADDVSYPERVRLQYQRLTHYEQEKGADLILCYGARRTIPADGSKPYTVKGIGHKSPEPVGWEYIGHHLPVKSHIKKFVWGHSASCALFMRRAVFELVGPFDPVLRRGQDIDYAIKAGLKGAHFISVDQTLFDWHITDADYKTDQKLLHYHHLMYQKYRYLFPNGFQYWCFWQSARARLCGYMAMRKQRNFLIKWHQGWVYFWHFMISPQGFFEKVRGRLGDIIKNRRANRTTLNPRKAGE